MFIRFRLVVRCIILIGIILPFFAIAQTTDSTNKTSFVERNLGGPRMGLMYLADDNDLAKSFRDRNLGRWMSQFGWLFEYQVIPDGGGPSFTVQFTSLVTGVEQGVFYPNLSLVLGIRTPEGLELGLGPNLIFGSGSISQSALTILIGKNFEYGSVNIPVNLCVSTSPKATRLSIMFGYAVAKVK